MLFESFSKQADLRRIKHSLVDSERSLQNPCANEISRGAALVLSETGEIMIALMACCKAMFLRLNASASNRDLRRLTTDPDRVQIGIWKACYVLRRH